MSKPIQVPFDKDGNMLDYQRDYRQVSFEYFTPFEDILIFDGFHRGRSSVKAQWIGSDGRKWPMFVTDLSSLLENSLVDHGKTERLTWTAQKRGQNYGIRVDK